MKIALLSDVHANLPALRAALRLCAERRVERVLFAGDLVGDGPFPLEVVEELRAIPLAAVRGNVDRNVLAEGVKRKRLRRRVEEAGRRRRNLAWSALQLLEAPEAREWLAALPEQSELEEAGRRVLLLHGSPLGDTDYIFPSLTPDALRRKLAGRESPPPDVLVCGHSHVPFARSVDGTLVVNCGSVGRPADGDPRGSFALLEVQEREPIRPEMVRFEYPVEEVVEALRERQVPGIDAEEYRAGTKS